MNDNLLGGCFFIVFCIRKTIEFHPFFHMKHTNRSISHYILLLFTCACRLVQYNFTDTQCI